MLTTYFKIAWRNLFRNRSFSLINIAGLAIGMTCTLLIFLWVYNEKNWDRYNANYSNIYHAMSNRDFNGEINTGQDLMYPLAGAAKAAFPEIERAAIVSFGENTLFTAGDKKLNKNTLRVSADFFDVFSFQTVEGDAAAAVKDPDAIVLTESTAMALFNDIHIINKPVKINNNRTAYVKAVIKDVPRNSTLSFEGLVPFNPSSPEMVAAEKDWVNCGNRVFLKTVPGTDAAILQKKILKLIQDRSPGENPTTRGSIVLHPMSKWRLYSEFKNGVNGGGRIEYVNLFAWIAVIILIIACVNFMNLSTARSEKRAREVGIRKTLGSERWQLLWQFITESVLLSAIAFLLALLLAYTLLPAFSRLLNEQIVIPYQLPQTWLLAGGIVIITGLIAGSYPAFYLSGFRPVKVLKGTFLPGRQGLLPRKILVISQFVASIIFISATLIVYQQLQYVKNRDFGYDQHNLVMVNSSKATDKSFDAFKHDLLQTGMVSAVNRTSAAVTNIFMSTSGIKWEGATESNKLIIGFAFTEADFIKTMQARLTEGRDFRTGDSNTVIFNKAAIAVMGIKDPIGKTIQWAGKQRTIIGVMGNMVMNSPYTVADPFMLCYDDKRSGKINIRLNPNADVKEAIAGIEKVYRTYSIEYPFEYQFIQEDFSQKFNNEQLIGKLSVTFAGLAIFICCLGLFGLVASSIERRKKELGIRKVLGASVQGLLLLMSKEFLLLLLIAFLIALPVAWWMMNNWLQDYTYRINIGIGIFLLVGLITLVVALITISLNASKAAVGNPVRTLRSE